MILWIVGRISEEDHMKWVFWGVFDSEEAALAACEDHRFFIGSAELNQAYNGEVDEDWPGAYYPLAEKRQ